MRLIKEIIAFFLNSETFLLLNTVVLAYLVKLILIIYKSIKHSV